MVRPASLAEAEELATEEAGAAPPDDGAAAAEDGAAADEGAGAAAEEAGGAAAEDAELAEEPELASAGFDEEHPASASDNPATARTAAVAGGPTAPQLTSRHKSTKPTPTCAW